MKERNPEYVSCRDKKTFSDYVYFYDIYIYIYIYYK